MIIQIKYFHDAKDSADAAASKPDLWIDAKDLDDAYDVIMDKIPKLRTQLMAEDEAKADPFWDDKRANE